MTPGDYYVEFDASDLSLYVFTQKDMGADDVDSDADPVTGKTDCFYLPRGLLAVSWDAGLYVKGTAALRGRVFNDMDQDGIQDSNEGGVENIGVELYTNASCTGSPAELQITDQAGEYAWANSNGAYCLQFYTTCWQISPQDQGGDDTKDSDADPATGQITSIQLTTHRQYEDVGLGVCAIYLPTIVR